MKIKDIAGLSAIALSFLAASCGENAAGPPADPVVRAALPAAAAAPLVTPEPDFPDLQAELMDDRFRTSGSPLGSFDFKNHTYPLPRGWQNPDGSDLTLVNGVLDPVAVDISEDMPDEEKFQRRAARRIGMSHVVTKYFDANGDGNEDAIVVLKIETTGAAIPQVVYVYEWKDDSPKLLWRFRTGDRADGGLKDLRMENGDLVIELYGQDRYILGETETLKITGDEEQLCCPTFFTKTFYKWNGTEFLRHNKRLTFAMADKNALPVENMGEIVNAKLKSAAKR